MKLTLLKALFGFSLILKISAKEWYETAAFYQIYPQSFYDGGGGAAGTGSLKGIEAKLDYIKGLGFDCLWLTPIFQSTFNAFGYDITDYTDIDPRYGSREDFENLIKTVHAKGLKIIVDFVPNHCGFEHEFFKKSIQRVDGYDDWFVWTNSLNYEIEDTEKAKPSNWQRIGGTPGSGWTKPTGRDEYYAQFHPNMPDLNLRNPKVLEYFESVMKFWLDLSIDGFRIDAISHGIEAEKNASGLYPNEERNANVVKEDDFGYLIHSHTQDQPELFEIIYDWREFLDTYRKTNSGEERIMMTESYSPANVIKKYYQSADGARNGAHLPFNFEMINRINVNSTAADFVSMVTEWFKIVPEGKVTNWVIGNHDQPRVANRFGEERVDILNTLVTMLPGTSVTYYGEEIGMTDSCAKFVNGNNKPAEPCDAETNDHQSEWARSPMQWSDEKNAGFSTADLTWIPIAKNYKTLNVKAQEGKDGSHLEIYRQLLKIRKHEAATDSNKFEIVALSLNSLAFKRELADKQKQSILVIVNFGNVTEKVDVAKSLSDLPGLMTVEVTGGNSAFKKGQQLSTGEFELKAFESIVAFYNNSSSQSISKFVAVLLVVVCLLSANIF